MRKEVGEDVSSTMQFFIDTSTTSFIPPGCSGPRSRAATVGTRAGKSTKEETVTLPLNLYVRIPKGLVGWVGPSPHLPQ